MEAIKTMISDTWEKLNPSDPSALYLVKFMGFAILVFVAGYTIGAILGVPI